MHFIQIQYQVHERKMWLWLNVQYTRALCTDNQPIACKYTWDDKIERNIESNDLIFLSESVQCTTTTNCTNKLVYIGKSTVLFAICDCDFCTSHQFVIFPLFRPPYSLFLHITSLHIAHQIQLKFYFSSIYFHTRCHLTYLFIIMFFLFSTQKKKNDKII